MPPAGAVIAVSRKATHGVGKLNQQVIVLIAGQGVEGDAHCSIHDQHASRWRGDTIPTPNLRQVHLLQAEFHDELAARGFAVTPGLMGENITTRGVDLLALPTGATVRIGDEAVVVLTGLRNPCVQLDQLHPGLREACLETTSEGLVRKAGVMGVVEAGGPIRPGDPVRVQLPDGPFEALQPV